MRHLIDQLFATLLGLVSLTIGSAYAATPVSCGDVLDEEGRAYVLHEDLVCNAPILISASGVRFDMARHSIICDESPEGGTTYGISTAPGDSVTDVRISNGTIAGCTYGLYLRNAYEAVVTGMQFTENLSGLFIEGGSDNRITQNSAVGNVYRGIAIFSSDRNRLIQNVCNYQTVGSGCGIGIDGRYNLILGNVAKGNARVGIFVGPRSLGNVVRSNIALENTLAGISFYGVINGEKVVAPMPRGNTAQENRAFRNLDSDLSEAFWDPAVRFPEESHSNAHQCFNSWINNEFDTAEGPAPCVK